MGEIQTGQVADTSAAVYIVSYVEVMPPLTDTASTLLRQYRDKSRQEVGNTAMEVLQQCSRLDHFAILEQWQNRQTYEAHGSAMSAHQCREQLRPLCVSPYEERPHHGLVPGAMRAARAAGAIYVVTHADAVPPRQAEAIVILRQLAEASRSERGSVHFAILQQDSRHNHCTIVEIWQDQQAYEAHVMSAHMRHFRTQFQPMSGSLYDERLYQALD